MSLYNFYKYIIDYPLNKLDFKSENEKNLYSTFNKNGFIHYSKLTDSDKFIELIHNDISNIDLKKLKDDEIKINTKAYHKSLNYLLASDTRKKIDEFFSSRSLIQNISSMMGYKMAYRKSLFRYNFFNENNIQNEDAKMFHRDSDTLHDHLKIFLLLNKIDLETGMFFYVPKNFIQEHEKLPFEQDRKNLDISNKWRNYDSSVLKISQNCIKSLNGKRGEALFIDTTKIYHKGGSVNKKGKYRLILETTFTPLNSLSNWNQDQGKIKTFFQNKLTSLKIKLQKNAIYN